MKTVYFLMSVTFLLLGCAHVPMGEHFVIDASSEIDKWQVLSYENFSNNTGYVRYYVPPGRENLKSWSELVTVSSYKGSMPLKRYVEIEVARFSSRCPGTKHQVIESDIYNMYYKFSFPSCGGRPPESQLNRVVQGNDGIYHLSYSVKNRELALKDEEKWLPILRKSFVANGDQHEKVR